MGYKRWTEKELKYLKENYDKGNKEELEAFLGRKWKVIQKQARKLGMFKGSRQILHQDYKKHLKAKEGYQYCKKCNRELPKDYKYFPKFSAEKNFRKVCRECSSKYGKFLDEGYKIRKIWTKEEELLLSEIYKHYTGEEIVEIYFNGLTKEQVEDKAYKLGVNFKTEETKKRAREQQARKVSLIMKGVPKSPESIKRAAETKRKLYKEGKLVSHWKGRIVTDEERMKLAERVRGKWAGKNNPRCKNPLFGEKNGRWSGGITPLATALRENIYEWKQESMKKCNYKCVLTGGEFDNIHHLYPFNKIIQEALRNLKLDVRENLEEYGENSENLIQEIHRLHKVYGLGVCLKKEIHKLFHDVYSYSDFSIKDFEEFKVRYLSGEFKEVI